jgi:hypothetical protein
MPRALRKKASQSAGLAAESDDDRDGGSRAAAHGAAASEHDGQAGGCELGAAGEDDHERIGEVVDVAPEEADNLLHVTAEIRTGLAGPDSPAADRPDSHRAVQFPGARSREARA